MNYGGIPRPLYVQPRRTRLVVPARGYPVPPRTSGFGVVANPYDPYYQAQYAAYPQTGVSVIPAGTLRPYAYADSNTPHTHTHLEPWRPDRLGASQNSHPCGAVSATVTYQYDTKDIVLRGKAKIIRQSYLLESPKFEAELVKYLDKKSKDQIPEHVVDMMITFINSNDYQSTDIIDEITLNILAHNVGCKSVLDASLSRLKKQDFRTTQELGEATAMILMCSKVDAGLKKWLKGVLEKNDRAYAVALSRDVAFSQMCFDRPELEVEFLRLVGHIPEPKDDKYRTL